MPLRRLTMAAAFAAALVAPLLGANAQAAPAAGQEGLQLTATHDSLLATHYWYVQTFAGHKVLGSYYAKHVNKATGAVTIDDGRLQVSGLVATAAPRLAPSAAESAAPDAYRNELAVLPGGQA